MGDLLPPETFDDVLDIASGSDHPAARLFNDMPLQQVCTHHFPSLFRALYCWREKPFAWKGRSATRESTHIPLQEGQSLHFTCYLSSVVLKTADALRKPP